GLHVQALLGCLDRSPAEPLRTRLCLQRLDENRPVGQGGGKPLNSVRLGRPLFRIRWLDELVCRYIRGAEPFDLPHASVGDEAEAKGLGRTRQVGLHWGNDARLIVVAVLGNQEDRACSARDRDGAATAL